MRSNQAERFSCSLLGMGYDAWEMIKRYQISHWFSSPSGNWKPLCGDCSFLGVCLKCVGGPHVSPRRQTSAEQNPLSKSIWLTSFWSAPLKGWVYLLPDLKSWSFLCDIYKLWASKLFFFLYKITVLLPKSDSLVWHINFYILGNTNIRNQQFQLPLKYFNT